MPRVGFEPTISAGERPKTYALDRAATGTATLKHLVFENWSVFHRLARYSAVNKDHPIRPI